MKITWRPGALLDLDAIETYIERDSPKAALRMQQLIRHAVGLLASQPRLGRPGRISGTRELVVPRSPYIVAYDEHDDEIRVLAVLHAARKWPHAL